MAKEFLPLDRQRDAKKFERINRWRDPSQSRREAALEARSPDDKSVDDFLDTLRVQAQTGRRQQRFNGHIQEFMDGAVIPRDVDFTLRHFLGLERGTIDDHNKGGWRKTERPFNLVALTQEFDCSRKTAADLMVAASLWESHYDCKVLLEHFDEWEFLQKSGVQIEQLREIFPDTRRLNQVTEAAFRRVLPLIAERAQFNGMLRMIQFGLVDFADLLKATFGNEPRRAEFKTYFQSQKIDDALSALSSYEVLFGQMDQSEFLQFFPNWAEAKDFNRYFYETRYKFPRPPEPDQAPVPQPQHITPDEEAHIPVVPDMVTPPVVPPPVAPRDPVETIMAAAPIPQSVPQKETVSTLQRHWKKVAGALALVATLATGAEWLRNHSSEDSFGPKVDPQTEVDRTQQRERQRHIEVLQQPRLSEPNNLASEVRAEQGGELPLFDPPFRGLILDRVYNTITAKPNRVLGYQPERAFNPADIEIDPEDSTVHTVAYLEERQSFILNPPEIGTVDPASIYIKGYDQTDFDIIAGAAEQGALGRFEVRLHEAPTKPFYVVYQMTAGHNSAGEYRYHGENQSTPKLEHASLLKEVQALGLERTTTETDYDFALRAQDMIVQKYYYPQSAEENKLPFTEAVSRRIGDCDVANTVLLAALHHNKIDAVLVGGMSGGTPHGEIMAFLREPNGSKTVKVLDATPGKLTSAGREAVRTQSINRPPQTSESAPAAPRSEQSRVSEPSMLQQVIAEYKAQHTVKAEEPKNIVTVQEYVAGKKTEQPVPLSQAVAQEKMPAVAEVAPAEWQAMQRGIYGYAEYLLQRNGVEPTTGHIVQTMHAFIDLLQAKQIIPPSESAEHWSKQIDQRRAYELKRVIQTQLQRDPDFITKNLH